MPNQFTRVLADVVCPTCNNVFRPSERRGRFCSMECSHRGRSRAFVTPLQERLFAGIDTDAAGCWLRTRNINHATGYSMIGIGRNRDYAHRIALERAMGTPIPPGFMSLHACDVRNCIRNDEPNIYVIRGIARPQFGHLWLGTQADNMADMQNKGRAAVGDRSGARRHPEKILRGDRAPWARLTDDAVREIRHRYATNTISLSCLGREYGVSMGMVSMIVRRERWAHVE